MGVGVPVVACGRDDGMVAADWVFLSELQEEEEGRRKKKRGGER